MLTIRGYYDGTAFQALEPVTLKKGQRVIITVLDEFIDPQEIIDNCNRKKVSDDEQT